ncbi:O-sialoglycoprotein endopeptidase [Alicyclobacillus sacchari]|uniref:tRNA N6-adenosine threonylcarbamoyltransferase n=1 Tax=Alicyclobacillus sacchari TaxID=392010 RepID=A0A4R8LTD3_9BACL|nr:tRNA (adenosine(37)-N6)-threonylcarbamoyltransferase complex transferase subunit TsaD [Alicyclobacillus sacchari]TDY49987.1 O-sialoglycoprotein endopeptidase [Alicyclobacillus sacchari]
MNILGIETSCDETSAAIVQDGVHLLAQVTASQIDLHARFGGVVPEVASRRHVVDITKVVEQVFCDARMTWSDIDAIAVTCGPGLLGSLLVGVSAAKGYALATGKPIVGVHHIAGHVAAAMLAWAGGTGATPPFLCLVVSGGHTELLTVDSDFRFARLGGTRDDAAGEAYDKVARLLGLAYPGGPKVDDLAHRGRPDAYVFPRALLEDDGFDFSFSGLKSAVNNEIVKRRNRGQDVSVEDVCASFQAAVVEVLVEKTRRAALHTGARTIVVAGGVAANRGLREAMSKMAQALSARVIFPPIELCTDNAAMIAAAAYPRAKAGRWSPLTLNAYAQLPLADWQDDHWPGGHRLSPTCE